MSDNDIDRALRAAIDFKPTPCREWTWWDRLVYRATGRVSGRVFRDRMANMAVDDYRREHGVDA